MNKSDGEPAIEALKDAAAKALEGVESIPSSGSSDGRHVVRVVPCAPKVPHAPKESRSRTRPSGLRPAEMRRRNYYVDAQPGAAEAEQRTRRWKKSTESGDVHKERGDSRVQRTREEGVRQRAVLSSFAKLDKTNEQLKADEKKGKQPENPRRKQPGQPGTGTQGPLKEKSSASCRL